jgi:group II intron reverse transcriptase/maturase
MNQQTLERLEHRRKRNCNRQWQNRDLYRLMYQEDLYILAYERLKSKPGNMTAGSDGETLDGFSLKQIQRIIQEMRTEQFQFKPVRTVYIPKPNGKMRKLGIPSIRDKVVHEVMHMILEAIYDSPYGAYFLSTSHGFRPNRSCHTALREYRTQWSATTWLIEGDIHACFDELAHEVLVRLLRKKITDERFLNLIWKLLRAGYMDLHGERKDSLIGSPQGGIVSPLLANVYLHELDEFVEQVRRRLARGKKKRTNPVCMRLVRQKRQLVQQGLTKTSRFREVVKHIRSLPYVLVNDPKFIRVKYLRYADDWVIGVCGSKSLAESIKEEVKVFLRDTLKLQLSEEKTRITNAKTEEAAFLGTTLKIGTGGTPKVVLTTNQYGKRFKRRSTGWETIMHAPLPRLVKRLQEKGFCTGEGNPIAKRGWSVLDLDQIVLLYGGINRGIQNYYRFADNWTRLIQIQYILHYSLAHTLALKLRCSVKKVFRRFGREMRIVTKGHGGKADRQACFYLNQDWSTKREAFQAGSQTHIDQLQTAARMRTRSKLGKPCCICGETGEVRQIEMHHVRHIRKLSEKREPTGFNRILRQLNRKQIPVCQACHVKVHQGTYDGMKLSNLAYLPV